MIIRLKNALLQYNYYSSFLIALHLKLIQNFHKTVVRHLAEIVLPLSYR